MAEVVFLAGRILPRAQASVSIDDRGFLLGDAVYEVVRVVGGRLVEPERHWRRLADSLRAVRIADPARSGVHLPAVANELLERNGLAARGAVIYLQVSRGAAARQHGFPTGDVAPTLLVTTTPFTPNANLAANGVAAITLPDERWCRCDIKSVNLLPNVLAAQRAAEADAFEAILHRNGVVTEATRSNVFAVVRGVVRTHPTGPAILPGVTRAIVIELARAAGFPVVEEPFALADLARAEEVFLTGTTADVMGVVQVDGQPVGDGRPGAITRRLGGLLAERIGVLPVS